MDVVLRALADQSRRTVLEALAEGEATAGELAALVPIARPGMSRHLRVLREAGLVEVRQQAQNRIYSLRPQPLAEVDEWLARYRAQWERLDALHTEVARGQRERSQRDRSQRDRSQRERSQRDRSQRDRSQRERSQRERSQRKRRSSG